MTKRTVSALLAAAFGLCATSAWADQPGQADLQQQVQQLQQQVKELQAQRANPSFTAKDVDATVDSVLHDSARRSQLLAETGGFYGGWMDDQFTIQSADGNYSMHPGIHFQFRNNTNYNQNGGSGGSDNTDNGFEVRNLRFSLDGTAITKNLYYNFVWNTDRTNGSLINEEAYVQYKFADNFAVKVGQFKEYIYHEQTVSDKRQLAVDRSLLNLILNGTGSPNGTGISYVQGVDLLWDNNSNLRADVAFTDGYNSRNTNFQDPPTNSFDFGVQGRIEWLVFGSSFKGYNQFSSMGNKAGDFLVIGAGGDWSQRDSLNSYHHNVDAQWNSGPLAVYAAYVGLYTDPGNNGSSGYDYGFLLQAGYMINTQWEVFGRYDYTHLDGTNSAVAHGSEDTFHEITVGLNYYLHGQNAKITLDAGWLPNGSPHTFNAIGVLANDGDNQYFVRAQFQLIL